MTIDDIKIDIYPSKNNDKTTLAYVNLTIPLDTDEGITLLKINNFRIMTDSYHKNSSGYHLVPPCIKSGSVYKEIVFFEKNKTFWYQLEGKVLKEYEDSILKPEMIGPKTIVPEIIDPKIMD
jgi:hypothetical protein